MSSFSFALLFSVVVALFCMSMAEDDPSKNNPKKENWEKNRLLLNAKPRDINRLRLLRQEIKDNGCDINLCFVLEDSYNVSPQEFEDQKNFVDLIVAITTTDEPGNYCAMKYDRRYKLISILDSNQTAFLENIRQLYGSYESASPNVIPAMGLPIKQLRRQSSDANTLVIFSKTKPTKFNLPFYYKQFVFDGNAISAVTFNVDNAPDLAKITGDINRVVPIDGFFEISETIVAVVADVCSAKCTTLTTSRSRRKVYVSKGRCPRRLGEGRFKFYKGVGGVGVGFGDGSSSEPENPKKRRN